MRDLTKFQCPKCGYQTSESAGITCPECGHSGDWVQPGETMTYAEHKAADKVDNGEGDNHGI